MKDGFIKVAAVTPEITVGDVRGNVDAITEAVKRAADEGARLIVLPELCITGATAGDLFRTKTLLDAAAEGVLSVAEKTAEVDALIVFGAPLRSGSAVLNCAVFANYGEIAGVTVKKNADGVFSGEGAELVQIGDRDYPCDRRAYVHERILQFSVEACFEGERINAGASIVALLSAYPDSCGRVSELCDYLKVASRENKCAIVYAAAGYGESTTDYVFSANNAVCECGDVLYFPDESDGLALADVDVQRIEFKRLGDTATMEADFFTTEITDTRLDREFNTLPFVPDYFLTENECGRIISLQAKALARRIERSGAKSAVIGLSGGLDSTLALIVTVHAFDLLGRDRAEIVAVTMPCFGTTERTKSNAERLAEAYGVPLRTVDIGESVRVHLSDIGHDGETPDVTYENAQARERTQVLMDIANMTGGMVIGTGDLSEMALGWATYNGDHMSMYSVNCSVPKTLVRALVSSVMHESRSGVYDYVDEDEMKEIASVLYDILATPVSPELTPAKDGEIQQKTEDIVGPYELHDFFIYNMLVNGYGAAKLYRVACEAFSRKYSPEVIEKWLRTYIRRFFSQQFKRSCVPDGPKVTELSLSPRGALSMPSDASPSAWLYELDERISEVK